MGKTKLWSTMVWGLAAGLMLSVTTVSEGSFVEMYVDSAPNVYGSPDYDPWWDSTKDAVVDGTFTNMSNGTYPGTTDVHPEDMIVYSYDDLGKRLHWTYWLEGETTSSLEGNFEVKWIADWAGTEFTYDWSTGDWIVNDAESGWTQPASWEDYDNGDTSGVIGTFGFAWWATAPEPNPDGLTPSELTSQIFANQTFVRGLTRYRESANDPWQYTDLELQVVPLPAPVFMGLAGLAGVAVLRCRKKTA